MPDKLLICTDLDRTLIPNGPQSESPMARKCFSTLTERPEVILAYASGRHRKLVKKAIINYVLPIPDFVIGDVGTTIYHVGESQDWQRQLEWEDRIAIDWGGKSHADLKSMLNDITVLRLQEPSKQNHFKLSYYVPLYANREAVDDLIGQRFNDAGVKASLIWSVDEPSGVGLLDILPAHASKFHAIKALMRVQGFDYSNTIFCGDSGNDIEVLVSPIPAVLVGNSQPDVRELAQLLARENGSSEQLYIAKGDFAGMNGNYSAGILEGIAHYYPQTCAWMGLDTGNK
jgi:HAD superfamily hydrolase (TIGR01484 family)